MAPEKDIWADVDKWTKLDTENDKHGGAGPTTGIDPTKKTPPRESTVNPKGAIRRGTGGQMDQIRESEKQK